MVNIEAVDQTGAGVYVAVLDTGLVPTGATTSPRSGLQLSWVLVSTSRSHLKSRKINVAWEPMSASYNNRPGWAPLAPRMARMLPPRFSAIPIVAILTRLPDIHYRQSWCAALPPM